MQITGCLRSKICAFRCSTFRRSYMLLGMHFSLFSTLFMYVYVDILSGLRETSGIHVSPFLAAVEEFISRFVMQALRRNIPCYWMLRVFCPGQNVGPYSRHDRIRGRLLLAKLMSVSYWLLMWMIDGWMWGSLWGKFDNGLAPAWGNRTTVWPQCGASKRLDDEG